ncbi:hypothetical protein NLU13_1210 [Sarocladium strictum]|uniref:Uncharacterized protein n=1 Tax=Sarocladium strictum TaxID=5046 RepID=A0AA39LBK0_SARSR|nr:hypothetical protein NLU13_1210 [Sarocladium strictum]
MSQLVRPTRSSSGKVAIVTGAGGLGNETGAAESLPSCWQRTEPTSSMSTVMWAWLSEGLQRFKTKAEERLLQYNLDVWISSAATSGLIIGDKGTSIEADVAEWAKGQETNVRSMMLMAKHAIPAMLRNEPEDGKRRPAGGTPSLPYSTSLARGAIDCAGTVRFLAGNEARWITGLVMTVDGGATCASPILTHVAQ